MKPDPEIYLRTAAALGVDARATASSSATARTTSSRGAERVGMTPVLFLPAGRDLAVAGGTRLGGSAVSRRSRRCCELC